MSRPILAVDQKNVRITVIVIINERAAWPQRFGQILTAKSAVMMNEVDSRWLTDIREAHGRGLGSRRSRYANGNADDPDESAGHWPPCPNAEFWGLAARLMTGEETGDVNGMDSCSWIVCR